MRVNISLYLPSYHLIFVLSYWRLNLILHKPTNRHRLIKQTNLNKHHFYRLILHHAEPLVPHVEIYTNKWNDPPPVLRAVTSTSRLKSEVTFRGGWYVMRNVTSLTLVATSTSTWPIKWSSSNGGRPWTMSTSCNLSEAEILVGRYLKVNIELFCHELGLVLVVPVWIYYWPTWERPKLNRQLLMYSVAAVLIWNRFSYKLSFIRRVLSIVKNPSMWKAEHDIGICYLG